MSNDNGPLLAVAVPMIEADEGCRLQAYQDTLGIWTIGYGHAHVLPNTRWTKAQCDAQLQTDLALKIQGLDGVIPWWRDLDLPRQAVLLNMAFNIGLNGLLDFSHTLRAIHDGKFSTAAGMMLDSLWARQVPNRAKRLATIMETGKLPCP